MSLHERKVLARKSLLCMILVGAVAVAALGPHPALAQADKYDNPVDLKPLIPPVFSPLPPNLQINPGALSSTPTPYGASPAPLQNPSQSQQAAPGFRLIIPSR